MEPDKYIHSTAELIARVFNGTTLIARSERGEIFYGGDFKFSVTSYSGNKLNVDKNCKWRIDSEVPGVIERSNITSSNTLPEIYTRDFLEMRKTWSGNIKVEMKLTPVYV